MEQFPHLKFVQKITGTPKLPGGPNYNKRTDQNKSNRQEHANNLGLRTKSLSQRWAEHIEFRAESDLPALDTEVIPVFLKVNPSIVTADFDLEKLEVVPNLVLSSSWEMRLPLRWIAILYSNVKASLAATTGIQSHEDVVKIMMAGGDVAMLASELLRNGVSRITELNNGLKNWMEENEYDSIEMMKGSMSQKSVGKPAEFERANYMKALQSYKQTI